MVERHVAVGSREAVTGGSLIRRALVSSRLGVLAGASAALACTTLAGLDHEYEVVVDAGAGSGGDSASGGTAGTGADGSGGSAASGASGGSGGAGGSAAAGGSGGVSGGGAGGSSGVGGSAATGGGGGGGGGSEICDNGSDDDADTRVDCFDADCSGSAACAGRCSEAALLPCNSTRAAQRTDAAGSTQRIGPPDYNCAPGARSGPEIAYRLEAVAGADVFFGVYGLDADAGVFSVEVARGAQCEAAQSCIAYGDVFPDAGPEALAFTAGNVRDYFVIVDGAASTSFNMTLLCSTNSTCRPARAIQAGQSLVVSNALGSGPNVTDNQESYSCSGGQRSSPEASFMFTPVVSGRYRIDVTGLSANLDLFVINGPNCNGTCSGAAVCASSPANGDETCTLNALAHTTYFIVIDGYEVSTFTLSVTAL